jgi:hypothetical protein
MYNLVKKTFYIFGNLIFFGPFVFAIEGEKGEQPPTPTALFQAVFLDRDINEKLLYAPWGNPEEENATLIQFSVSSGNPSTKIAYYSTKPIQFFRATNGSESKVSKQAQLYEYSFIRTAGVVEELLFLSDPKKPSRKVNPFSYSDNKVPMGSFLLSSLAKEKIFVNVAEQKFVLPPSGVRLLKFSEITSQNKVRIECFLARKGKYVPAYSKKIIKPSGKRGLVFLKVEKDFIKPLSIIEYQRSQRSALGLGTSPHRN